MLGLIRRHFGRGEIGLVLSGGGAKGAYQAGGVFAFDSASAARAIALGHADAIKALNG